MPKTVSHVQTYIAIKEMAVAVTPSGLYLCSICFDLCGRSARVGSLLLSVAGY
jgi:hypothetical protein